MILANMKTVRLKGGFVVTPQGVERTDIILRDGRVALAGGTDRCDQVVDIIDKYVVPGFVDIHFHGYNLFEFTTGLYDVKSDVAVVEDEHARQLFENLAEQYYRPRKLPVEAEIVNPVGGLCTIDV